MDDETEARLAACRKLLFEAQEPRVRPGRDHKVLADWNGRIGQSCSLPITDPEALRAALSDGSRRLETHGVQ